MSPMFIARRFLMNSLFGMFVFLIGYIVLGSSLRITSTPRPSSIKSDKSFSLYEDDYFKVVPQKVSESFIVEARSSKYFVIGGRVPEYISGEDKFILTFSSTEGGEYFLTEARGKVKVNISFNSEEMLLMSYTPFLTSWGYILSLVGAGVLAVLCVYLYFLLEKEEEDEKKEEV